MTIVLENFKFWNLFVSDLKAKSVLCIVVLVVAIAILSSCTSSNIDGVLSPANSANINNISSNPAVNQYANTEKITAPNDGTLLQNQKPLIGVEFLPRYGIPQIASSAFSSAIRNSAKSNAITVIRDGEIGASYRVKGHFYAIDQGTGTTLIAQWDILDTSGKKLYHITDQQFSGAVSNDPWLAISKPTIHATVDRLMKNMRVWIDYNT